MRQTDGMRDREIGAALQELPVPPISEGFFQRLRVDLVHETETSSHNRAHPVGLRRRSSSRQRMASSSARPVLVTAALTVLFAVPAGFALGSSASGGPDTDPVNKVTTFQAAPEWNTVTTTFGPIGQKLSIAWAANVPFASESDVTGFPSKTIQALPRDGIVMTAIGPRSYTGEESFPDMSDPLDLSQGRCVSDEYEGQPAPNVSKCMIDVMVGDRLVNVMVWFGTTKPYSSTISLANEELARLDLGIP